MTRREKWISIESRRVLSLNDQELVLQLLDGIEQARQIAERLPAILHVMRDYMAGQPQGSRLGGDGPAPWCWAHERTTVECDREGLLCDGELVAGPGDPTGNAAVTGDRASGDYRRLRREAELLQVQLGRLVKLTAAYPVEHLEREFVEPSPGEEWCRSCWRDDRYCEPIARKANGKAYYAGLCKWCGSFRSEHDVNPPVELLQARHRGERITAPKIRAALAAAAKSKGRRQSARSRR
jgi:hypothetical protein